jgi:hypothetical protein
MNNRNHKYISMDVIANRILKHPLLKDMNYEDIISHTVDVLRLVNVPATYEEGSMYRDIIEYKAKLPQDNMNLKTVDYVRGNSHVPMVIATDSLNNHLEKLPSERNNRAAYTYTVNGGMIHTNQETGRIFITYDQLKCGPEGIPMIPDSVSLIKAIENYIKVQVFSVLVDLQKMGGASLQRAEQEYSWYIGKAQTEFQGFMNEDDLESFLRDFKRLFIENTNHKERNMYNVNREVKFKN